MKSLQGQLPALITIGYPRQKEGKRKEGAEKSLIPIPCPGLAVQVHAFGLFVVALRQLSIQTHLFLPIFRIDSLVQILTQTFPLAGSDLSLTLPTTASETIL